jgi:membrane glycosyltransferase
MPQPTNFRWPLALRVLTLGFAAAASIGAGWAFLHIVGGRNPGWLDWLRTVLLVVVTFWLVWGGVVGLLGALAPRPRRKRRLFPEPKGRTAILIPVYNEDPVDTFARIAAMNRQLVMLGVADKFHFAILSDSTSLEVAALEVANFEHLVREPEAEGRIFYRRRENNVGRKAGNIEDFVARSGGAYDYAVILDADSLMEGATLVEMACRMDDDPKLGLLQTVPEVIGAWSLFGRMMAFSSAYLSPYFARGSALMQGDQGPYWGHNAIVRLRAFAQCCGLPVLSGQPPYGGHILSHDYVEAALLARGGWKVEVDPTLTGSYEHGPDNMIEFAKRDRRWCQGNLQHRRLLGAPGLRIWNRFTLLQGIMAYMASPLWLVLLVASIFATAYPDPGGERLPAAPWFLGLGVAAALLVPKFAIAIRGAFDGTNRRFGGTFAVLASVLSEIVLTTLMAPALLAYQSRSVGQILLGLDGGWPATERDARTVPFRTAWSASWWIAATGLVVMVFMAIEAPNHLFWLLPVGVPAILAPAIVWLSSHDGGRIGRGLFESATQRQPSAVMLENRRVLNEWASPLPIDTLQPITAGHAPA